MFTRKVFNHKYEGVQSRHTTHLPGKSKEIVMHATKRGGKREKSREGAGDFKVSGTLTHHDASRLDVVSLPDGCVMHRVYQPAVLLHASYCLDCADCHCDLAAEDTHSTHMQSYWQTCQIELTST